MKIAFLPCLMIAVVNNQMAIGDDTKQVDIDKRAFLRARKAADAKTWDAAIAILDKIDLDKVEDVDVIEYVDFSTRCAKLANELGIARESDPNKPTDVVFNAQVTQVLATVGQKLLKREIPLKLVSDAVKIKKQIPRYQELDQKLAKKYKD